MPRMQKMFFGKRKQLFRHPSKTALEFVSFEREGKAHTHRYYETCYIMSGSGQIVSGEDTHEVTAGMLLTIPPKTKHWMIPGDEKPMDMVILYHPEPIEFESESA